MHIKKHLGFDALRGQLSNRFNRIKDIRQEGKVNYSLHDCFMSGFAMMYFQDSSLNEFQQRMEDEIQQNNLRTIFHVENIPKETQMRDVIDDVSFRNLEPLFDDYFRVIQRGKHLERYQFFPEQYIVSIDGTSYFYSEKINCPGCLIKEHKKTGEIDYSHLIVQAALMHPDCRQVIPLTPEPVINTDGQEKQDCEINAGKRLIDKIRESHPRLGIIIVADSLHAKQPMIEKIKANRMHFILAVKHDDHKLLMEWIEELRKMGEVSHYEVIDETCPVMFLNGKGCRHIYEWVNNIPLNGNENSIDVNYFEYWIINNGKVTYHNSWVTDFMIKKDNVARLVKGGRCRWKIENETFNTLKNQGYHIEHNFGHGKKNLSMNFLLLNLLAFFMHQIFELTCLLYQKCRAKFSSRREYWNQLRCTFRILIFISWEALLNRILSPP